MSTAVIVAAIVMLGITIASAADQQVIKVGKKGDVSFNEPTQVGDVTLPPGHYVFQHRVSGGEHFVKFVGGKEMHHAGTAMTTSMQTGRRPAKRSRARWNR